MKRYLLQNILGARLGNEATIQRDEQSSMTQMEYIELRNEVIQVLYQLEQDVGEQGNQASRQAPSSSCRNTEALHLAVGSRSSHKVDLGEGVSPAGEHHWERLLRIQGCDDRNMETELVYFGLMKQSQTDC